MKNFGEGIAGFCGMANGLCGMKSPRKSWLSPVCVVRNSSLNILGMGIMRVLVNMYLQSSSPDFTYLSVVEISFSVLLGAVFSRVRVSSIDVYYPDRKSVV